MRNDGTAGATVGRQAAPGLTPGGLAMSQPRPSGRIASAGPPRGRWTINGDFLGLAPFGVARYAREVTIALDALIAEGHPSARGIEIDLVAPTTGRPPLDLCAIPSRVIPEFDRPRLPQVWVQAQLPRHVRGGLLSFCNLAPVSVRRQIVCIHDLHTRLAPESYGSMFRLAHAIVLPLLGRRVAAVTTVSQFSRDKLIEHRIAAPEQITVTYNGSEHTARWVAKRSRLPQAERPFALAFGRLQPYKNAGLLIEVAARLYGMGLDLWMAGDVEPAALRNLAGRPLPPNLRLIGRVGDDDLAGAFAQALCFLIPSRLEGFGIPAVEAMALGCPVVASTAPCLPEVCGAAALYADPEEPEAWVARIDALRTDATLRARLVEAGVARARGYSWRSIAEHYLALAAQVDAASDRSASP